MNSQERDAFRELVASLQQSAKDLTATASSWEPINAAKAYRTAANRLSILIAQHTYYCTICGHFLEPGARRCEENCECTLGPDGAACMPERKPE